MRKPAEAKGTPDPLSRAYEQLAAAHKLTVSVMPFIATAGPDTAFAIGEAAGSLSKAMSLLDRDIHDRNKTQLGLRP